MTVFASGDRLLPIDSTSQNIAKIESVARGGSPIELVGGLTISHDAIYRQQPWIRAIIDKLSHGIGRLPAKTFREATGTNGARARVRFGEHRGADLVHRPFAGGTPFLFWGRIVHDVAKEGRGYAVLLRPRPSAPPNEAVPVAFRCVRPKFGTNPDGSKVLLAWEVSIGGVRRILHPDDVVVFQFPSGISPLASLARTVAMEDASQRAAIASFSNGIRPSGIVSLDPGVLGQREGKMTKTQLEYLRDELTTEHGGVDNRFRLAAINAAIRWTPLAHTAQEAEMIAHRKLNREEACGVYDMPPPVVHILDRATYSNIDEQHRMLYMDTMGPWLTMLEQTWNAAVYQHPAHEADLGGVYLEFDLDGVLRGDLASRADAYTKLIRNGFTLNEIRGLENLPRIEHPLADAVFVPRDLLPIGEGIPADLGDLSIAASRLGLAKQYSVISDDEVRGLLNRIGADLDENRDVSSDDAPPASTVTVPG